MQHEHTHAPPESTHKPLTLRTGLRAGLTIEAEPVPTTVGGIPPQGELRERRSDNNMGDHRWPRNVVYEPPPSYGP
jgi:hypothetical protein